MLRKKNRIKTLAGTLEIEGNFLGEEKITAILEGKKVLATIPELAEVQGAIKAYEKLEEYYKAIEDSTNLGESTPFIEFMLDMILESIKSDQKILNLIQENNNITINELCKIISMSESGVKKVIKKLKDEKKIKRVGSLKSGHWEVEK